RASRGIVVIDEIDKIARRGDGGASTRDVGGEGVQQALLKMIESDKVTIYPDGARSRPHKELIQIDTTHVLFILCGAFVGLEKVIKQRTTPGSIGFASANTDKEAKLDVPKGNKYNDLIEYVTHEDFVKFGLIPEFMGRLPVAVAFNQLEEDDLYEILWKPKNSLIRQYKRLFELEQVALRFTPEAMKAIVNEAINRKSGARGLRSILEEIMLDIMYELPDLEDVTECVITEGVVVNGDRPELVLEKQSA
ncbi:MAG: AAA family ATPase, partial [Bradymonadia bacterium]